MRWHVPRLPGPLVDTLLTLSIPSEVVKIGSIIIFHMSLAMKSKVLILQVEMMEKFKLITLRNYHVNSSFVTNDDLTARRHRSTQPQHSCS